MFHFQEKCVVVYRTHASMCMGVPKKNFITFMLKERILFNRLECFLAMQSTKSGYSSKVESLLAMQGMRVRVPLSAN